MKTLWRISNHVDLGGWGGRKFSSRWTSLGRRVTYMAETPAGAMVEILVHLKTRDDDFPRTLTLLEIEVPDESGVVQDLMPLAETDWKDRIEMTQRVGDRWLDSRESPLARVPSAIMPHTWNILLNPEHPEAVRVRVISMIRERFDNRLFRLGPR